jgi:hypothetical protein
MPRSSIKRPSFVRNLTNKGVAQSEIANLLAVPLAEVAVIGDGGNDVAMFERSS